MTQDTQDTAKQEGTLDAAKAREALVYLDGETSAFDDDGNEALTQLYDFITAAEQQAKELAKLRAELDDQAVADAEAVSRAEVEDTYLAMQAAELAALREREQRMRAVLQTILYEANAGAQAEYKRGDDTNLYSWSKFKGLAEEARVALAEGEA